MLNGIKRIEYGNIVWIDPKTGELHRLNGPAYINKKSHRTYYINGECHNINGPAIIWNDGKKEYWIDNNCYFGFITKQKHKWLLISLKRKLIDGKKY